jgi:hypothetical protein
MVVSLSRAPGGRLGEAGPTEAAAHTCAQAGWQMGTAAVRAAAGLESQPYRVAALPQKKRRPEHHCSGLLD